jgi:hypothetical protein
MTIPILICECGVRFKVRGTTPGKVGRCPNCGATLRVPDQAGPEESEAGRNRASEPTEMGYGLVPEEAAVTRGPGRARSPQDTAARPMCAKPQPSAPMADGFLPVLSRPETKWLSSLLYPLRGAEPLGVIAMTSATLWLFGVLVPEYCLGLINDATSMGATSIGHFVALISMLPVIMLFPLALSYWLQYLGRVLVSSAMGETSPPRVPDRNFDGFFNGLSPWLIWLCLGVFAGLIPLLAYAWSLNAWGEGSPYLAGVLGLLAFPYIMMALMMSFLHDDAFAAWPWAVIAAICRLAGSFGLLCLFLAGTLAVGVASFGLALIFLRPSYFWLYVLVCLACWIIVQWIMIVVMRILGLYYYQHKNVLKWHAKRPRWGVAWRL